MKEKLHIIKDHLFRTFTLKTLLVRIEAMGMVSEFEDKPLDIEREKLQLSADIDAVIEKLHSLASFRTDEYNYNKHQDPQAAVISSLEEYKRDLSENGSFSAEPPATVRGAFDAVIADFADRKIRQAVEKSVLFIQLLGCSKGNPLILMKGYKLVNGAWRNGSVEGYPIIVLLDSLPKTYTISKRHLSRAYARTWTHHIRLAEGSYNELQRGSADRAGDIFSLLVDEIFPDAELQNELRNEWKSAYASIVPLFTAQKTAESNPPASVKTDANPDRKKVIVSGMGWSGSGAVYAYLKEFGEIQAISTEIQHITGESSTQTLRQAAGDPDTFRNELVRFFGLGLFGYAGYDNYQEYRTLTHANQFTVSEGARHYARGVRDFIYRIVNAYDQKGLDEDAYGEAVNRLLDVIAGSKYPVEGKTLLFDNIIKMHELKEFDFLKNAYIIPVYRDPRSNYAALCRESVKFNPSVYQYIRNYRKRRQKTDAEFSAMRKKESVRFIQFEEFVTSEAARSGVAEWLGLDVLKQDEYSSFKPWISDKNVLNYQDFEDQKAIKVIEKELPDYLWEK